MGLDLRKDLIEAGRYHARRGRNRVTKPFRDARQWSREYFWNDVSSPCPRHARGRWHAEDVRKGFCGLCGKNLKDGPVEVA